MKFTINYLDDSKTLVNYITTAFLIVKTPGEECFARSPQAIFSIYYKKTKPRIFSNCSAGRKNTHS